MSFISDKKKGNVYHMNIFIYNLSNCFDISVLELANSNYYLKYHHRNLSSMDAIFKLVFLIRKINKFDFLNMRYTFVIK